MFSKSTILNVVLATVLFGAYRAHARQQTEIEELYELVERFDTANTELFELGRQLNNDFDQSHAMNVFLIDLMNRYELPLDEFDAIALKFYSK